MEFAGPFGIPAWPLSMKPVELITTCHLDEVLPALGRVQAALDGGRYAAGFVAYEAAPAFDPAMAVPRASDLPLLWFGIFDAPPTAPDRTDSAVGDEARSVICEPLDGDAAFQVGDWQPSVDDARWRSEVEAIRGAIAAGEVYQVNHTLRLRAGFRGDAVAWYDRLRAAQQAPYSAYLDLGRFRILSLSPELFFAVRPAAPGRVGPAHGPRWSNWADVKPPSRAPSCSSSSPCPISDRPRVSSTRPQHGTTDFRREATESGAARVITTRPMKGTHRRGRWPTEDRLFRERLQGSEKERAENLMIVDLLRNDLGRIAETGSVAVDSLFDVETYPTLLQMTSTVSARLRPGAGLPAIFSALFPCGSVTGAPKIAAMRKIAALEPEPRGAYCGAIGYAAPDGSAVFSVAIRTLVVDRETGVVQYGVGSGITWDSRAEEEARETRLKAAVLTAAPHRPDLFETLRLEGGRFRRRRGHVARILASAAYFGIPARGASLDAALFELARGHPAGSWRVRLRLSAEGAATAEAVPLDRPGVGCATPMDSDGAPCPPVASPERRDRRGSESPERADGRAHDAAAVPAAGGDGLACTFALASEPVDRADRRLFHKIADRSGYARRKAEHPGVYDVLLRNREGELTEFTTGNLVIEVEGRRCTPPLDCGLLPGVFRAELLARGHVAERVLTRADLERAGAVWLVNSLRGWVPMRRDWPAGTA